MVAINKTQIIRHQYTMSNAGIQGIFSLKTSDRNQNESNRDEMDKNLYKECKSRRKKYF